MNLCCTETLHTGTGKLPRFHPVCLRQKTILIHVMITESPCRIKAAPRWYSVSRNIRIFTPYRSLSEMTGQLTVLFNTFIIIFTLQRLFYIKIRMSVKPETASKRRKHLPCCKFCLCKLNLNTKWCFLFLCLFSCKINYSRSKRGSIKRSPFSLKIPVFCAVRSEYSSCPFTAFVLSYNIYGTGSPV